MAQSDVIQENFFQAIDTIVQNRIANLPYDKTIECEVVEQLLTEKNLYKVQYQGVQFEATSIVTDLNRGDIVYVQIPQNDFRKEKFIIALKRSVEVQKVKTLPFLTFIKGSNLFSNIVNKTTFNLELNSHKEVERQFTFLRFGDQELAYGFTRMGLKATFGAAINTELSSGNYGIRIRIYGYNQKEWTQSGDELWQTAIARPNQEEFYKDFYLKKEDMIGTNLYNTHGFQNQEKVFDITGWVIDSIVVSLWQDNNFKDMNGTDITNKFITITNLQLYLGYDVTEVRPAGESTIFMITKDGLLYDNPRYDEVISKQVDFRVIQREKDSNNYYENNSLLLFNTNDLSNYPKLEQYNPTSETASTYSKKYYFVPFSNYYWLTENITDEIIKVTGTRVYLNRDNKFIDPIKNGFCYTLKDGDYVSNELWFVHKDNKDLLDELLNSGISDTITEEVTIAGALVYTGPELLFKSSDGTILMRLNVNNSEFMGTSRSATYTEDDTYYYDILKNLQKIETKLKTIDNSFALIRESKE